MCVKSYIGICFMLIISFTLCVPNKAYAQERLDYVLENQEDILQNEEDILHNEEDVLLLGEEAIEVSETQAVSSDIVSDDIKIENLLYIIIFLLGVIVLCQFKWH